MLHKELTYEIRGILFEVHNELGRYKSENQYCDAIEEKFKKRGMSYKREMVVPTSFKGEKSGRGRTDFIIENKVVLEIKCVPVVNREHYFQCQRYLSCLGLDLALLVNFRTRYLTIRRILNSSNTGHP